jgi:hypothetical protein
MNSLVYTCKNHLDHSHLINLKSKKKISLFLEKKIKKKHFIKFYLTLKLNLNSKA